MLDNYVETRLSSSAQVFLFSGGRTELVELKVNHDVLEHEKLLAKECLALSLVICTIERVYCSHEKRRLICFSFRALE